LAQQATTTMAAIPTKPTLNQANRLKSFGMLCLRNDKIWRYIRSRDIFKCVGNDLHDLLVFRFDRINDPLTCQSSAVGIGIKCGKVLIMWEVQPVMGYEFMRNDPTPLLIFRKEIKGVRTRCLVQGLDCERGVARTGGRLRSSLSARRWWL